MAPPPTDSAPWACGSPAESPIRLPVAMESPVMESPVKPALMESPVKPALMGSPVKQALMGSPVKPGLMESPVKPEREAASAQKRKTPGASKVPGVTEWVVVVLDKRRQSNKALSQAPAVVSSLDLEKGTVNLLYPNHMSAFLYRCTNNQNRILFAIETHPLSKVRRWEGPMKELNNLLQHALLHFAEQRGTALRNSENLRVEARPSSVILDSSAKVAWSAQIETKKIQQGLVKFVAGSSSGKVVKVLEPDDKGKKLSGDSSECCKSDSEPPPAAAPSPVKPKPPPPSPVKPTSVKVMPSPVKPTPVKVVVPSPVKALPSTPVKEAAVKEAVAESPSEPGDLRAFTGALARLLGMDNASSMPKSAIRDALGAKFPEWDAFLSQLDEMNKILVAEDAVFKL